MKTLVHGKAVEKADILPATLVISRLALAIRTHTNDDRSAVGTKERDRFVERDTIMREAHALIEDMAGKVADYDQIVRELSEARTRVEKAERAAIALENVASALRHNEARLLAQIDDLSKNQMPWGV